MFTDQQRQVYEAPDGRRFDPLRVYHTLRIAAGGLPVLNAWFDDRAEYDRMVLEGKSGDTPEFLQADVAEAKAAQGLAAAARAALAFDKSTLDAVVLETLYHFVRYLEGKGSPAASGPTSRPGTEGPSANCWPPMPTAASGTRSTSGSG